METRICSECRHWKLADGADLGECRRGWPTPNGTSRAVWPLTMPVDSCGYFAAPAGSGTQGKITDAEILEMVRAGNYNGLPHKRAWLINDMIERGLARSSAVERVAKLARDGAIVVGLVTPPKFPRWKHHHPAVWLPGHPPDGAGGPARVEPERREPGRPAYDTDLFVEVVRAAAPVEKMAVRRADLYRAMRSIVPTLGASTCDRLVQEMKDEGVLKSDGALYWAADAVPVAKPVAKPVMEVE